jgi:uncharacterized ParB-like nuclease family protein
VLVDIPIKTLLESSLVNPTSHLDVARVQRYVTMLDELPPVTVFRLANESAWLLADGYHRLAAAQEAGRSTLRAEVRVGSKADALRFAIDLAVRERGISEDEARAAIRRLSEPEDSQQCALIARNETRPSAALQHRTATPDTRENRTDPSRKPNLHK